MIELFRVLKECRIGESPAWSGDVVHGCEASPQLVGVLVELSGFAPPEFWRRRG